MASMNAVSNNLRHRVAAAAKVFDDHGNFIRYVIQSHVRDEDQAGDLFQDFFLSLIRNPLPGDIENVKGYLYRAITNSIVGANRRTGRYQDFICAHAELSSDSASRTPHELLVQTEEATRAFELIEKRLPNGEARALTLRYKEQCNGEEAAEKMCVNSKTFRAYVCQGLCRIRRLLKNIEVRGQND